MKALFLNPGGIGDQILFLPVVKLLKEHHSKIEIDLITEPRSKAIENLTEIYRKVKVFDFKGKDPNLFELKKIMTRHKYKYCFIPGLTNKAGVIGLLSNAERKIGFNGGITSKLFFTDRVKHYGDRYTPNMFAEFLTPIIPSLKKELENKLLVPEIRIKKESMAWAKEVLTPRIKERYYAKKIVIHPGSSKLSKSKNILKDWSAQNWATLIEKLLENNNNVVILIGGKDDDEVIREIQKKLTFFAKPKNFFDFTSLEMNIEQLAAVISYSDLLLCVDSAPMHLAVSLGKKVVSFFGPTDPKKLLPADPRFKPVYVEGLDCRPCLFDKRTESCEKPVCLDLSPTKVLEVVEKQLNYSSI